jgi:hypothetical protein
MNTPAVTMVAADKGADRRGAFHGVRQPDIEWYLRRFAGGADKEQQADERDHAHLSTEQADALRRCWRGSGLEHFSVVQSTEGYKDEHHAQHEPEVSHAVHYKCLDAGIGR